MKETCYESQPGVVHKEEDQIYQLSPDNLDIEHKQSILYENRARSRSSDLEKLSETKPIGSSKSFNTTDYSHLDSAENPSEKQRHYSMSVADSFSSKHVISSEDQLCMLTRRNSLPLKSRSNKSQYYTFSSSQSKVDSSIFISPSANPVYHSYEGPSLSSSSVSITSSGSKKVSSASIYQSTPNVTVAVITKTGSKNHRRRDSISDTDSSHIRFSTPNQFSSNGELNATLPSEQTSEIDKQQANHQKTASHTNNNNMSRDNIRQILNSLFNDLLSYSFC